MEHPVDTGSFEFFKDKKKIYPVLGAVILLFILCLWYWRFNIYPYESTDDANIEGVLVSVSPEVTGRIMEQYVDEGDRVKTGELLLIIDGTLMQAEKERAQAMVQNAIDEMKLQQVKVELAWQDFLRSKLEFDKQVISPEQMDHQQKGLEAAKAALAAMESQVAVQEANLKAIQKKLDKCRVYAPCDGNIGKRWHFPGDVVREGQTVFSLFDLTSIWVTANLEETKLGSIRFNNPVKIHLDAYPHLDFEGNVVFVGAGAASEFSLIPSNNASGNFTKVTQRVPVRISIRSPYADESLYIRPGMSAEVKIKTR